MKNKAEEYKIVFIGMVAIIVMVLGMAIVQAQTIYNDTSINAQYIDKTIRIETTEKPLKIVMVGRKKVRDFKPKNNKSIISTGRLPKGDYIVEVVFTDKKETFKFRQL